MNDPAAAAQLYTDRARDYVRFVRLVGYPRGLYRYFLGSPLLRANMRVLDAGCGTGIVTLALRRAFLLRDLPPAALHAFDLTPAMLDRFRRRLGEHRPAGVELVQADVLQSNGLPESWRGYDLIVSASMMEYLPRERLAEALAGLRARLTTEGALVLFISRENALMRPLIGRWWNANLYTAGELGSAFRRAGFARVDFRAFPPSAWHLNLWGHVVEARG